RRAPPCLGGCHDAASTAWLRLCSFFAATLGGGGRFRCGRSHAPRLAHFLHRRASQTHHRSEPVPAGPPKGTTMVLMKYGIAALGSGLWAYGLVDQLGSLASVAKYLTISLLMVAVSLL